MPDEQIFNSTAVDKLESRLYSSQVKYTYYIIAVAVSAIAYGLSETKGQILNFSVISALIAIFTWGLSAACGVVFLNALEKCTQANLGFFYGKSEISKLPIHDDLKNDCYKRNKTHMDDQFKTHNKTLDLSAAFQKWLFITGVALYFLGHVAGVGLNTKKSEPAIPQKIEKSAPHSKCAITQ